jgi:hypothetical protein
LITWPFCLWWPLNESNHVLGLRCVKAVAFLAIFCHRHGNANHCRIWQLYLRRQDTGVMGWDRLIIFLPLTFFVCMVPPTMPPTTSITPRRRAHSINVLSKDNNFIPTRISKRRKKQQWKNHCDAKVLTE